MAAQLPDSGKISVKVPGFISEALFFIVYNLRLMIAEPGQFR